MRPQNNAYNNSRSNTQNNSPSNSQRTSQNHSQDSARNHSQDNTQNNSQRNTQNNPQRNAQNNSQHNAQNNSQHNAPNSSQNNWQQDPRLKQMNNDKLEYLMKFASQMQNTQKDQMMSALTAMQMDARQNNIQFNDQESDLLMSILSANMSPAEKKRMESIRALAQKLAVRNS